MSGFRSVVLNANQEINWKDTIRDLGCEIVELPRDQLGPDLVLSPEMKFLVQDKHSSGQIHLLVVHHPKKDGRLVIFAMEHLKGCDTTLATRILNAFG